MKKTVKRNPKRSIDMMGVIDTAKTQRVLILDPNENMPDRTDELVALSTCEITFDREQDLQRCIQALRESDEALKKRPGSLKMWEWTKSYREGMKVIFGVSWYDREFFEARKDVYKSATHTEYFKKFGATPDRFVVRHELIKS